jgi:hypothetical protein
VSNAVATLEGLGSVLSDESGVFVLRGVPLGTHQLSVQALGYSEVRFPLVLAGDTLLEVHLSPEPIALDSVTVMLGKTDLRGRVADRTGDRFVVGADVASDQGHRATTNREGAFVLRDIFDGPPIGLTVRAFRYLPLDTVLDSEPPVAHQIGLAVDPFMASMLREYSERLDKRTNELRYLDQPPLDRAALDDLSPNTSLQRALEARYPRHIVRRIMCFVIDEREYRFSGRGERTSVLEGTFVSDIERIELLEFPSDTRLLMARVYTTRFVQRHVLSTAPMARPSMILTPGGLFCS